MEVLELNLKSPKFIEIINKILNKIHFIISVTLLMRGIMTISRLPALVSGIKNIHFDCPLT